jgi:predicted GIY-YIG superfamily endonuclease
VHISPMTPADKTVRQYITLPAKLAAHVRTFEPHSTARSAIAREKEIKKWRRAKKVALIESLNPHWNELGPSL